jgi:hypothetical protein
LGTETTPKIERAENRRLDCGEGIRRDDAEGVIRAHAPDEPVEYSPRLANEFARDIRLSTMRSGWDKMREYLRTRYDADPTPENRHAVGKMLIDIACVSKKEATILKALGQFCKVYGHDEKTIVTQDASSKVERLRQWKDALQQLALKEADVIDGTVTSDGLRKAEEATVDPGVEITREVNASLKVKR